MSVSIDQVRRDIKRHTEASMSIQLSFSSPTGDNATVTGFGTAHHLSYNPDTGMAINSKQAHCSFYEKSLSDEGYTVRINDEVSLKNHKVSFTDSAGVVRTYKINEAFPDETLGLIVCILGEYGS